MVGVVTAPVLLIVPAMAVNLPESVALPASDAPPPTKEQQALNNIYQLNRSMRTIFCSDLSVSQPKRIQTQLSEVAEHATMSGSWIPRSAS
jgi:hypothetical protein